ncbi:autotransporter assembly complex protein TamA [Achromobacter aloeverae]|uniref:Bacterial surface antigen (D15) domain-containing protein n=1 Tax=Achromobacter aloeverae TaxID=1750518 RepID=A0A4V1MS93_9BURK|nr:BamA/TamA family outer membrane protein [Achromobacter aloeverae]RXN90512.1 hypothetical protein C7R54_13540 [Achromobacter aloeverae]
MRRSARLLLLWSSLLLAASADAKPQVVIDAGKTDAATVKAVNDAVDAIARQSEDQDGGEITRLRRRARDAALAALSTQGYFAAKVELDPGRNAAGDDTWNIRIEPGQQARVVSVDIEFRGRITRPAYAKRVADLRKRWSLAAGEPFTNSEWNKAKSAVLNDVSTHDFMLARMVDSAADVNVEAGTVALRVVVDSGPLVRLGDLRVEGLKRVPETLVRRYVRYKRGDPYEQDQLNSWQQALQRTAFFRGAFVSLQEPGGTQPDTSNQTSTARDVTAATPAGDARVTAAQRPAAPVDRNGEVTLPVVVRLTEAQPKRFSSSIGVDSDVGPRLEMTYQQQVVFGQPLTMESGLGLDRLRQRAYTDFHLPPDARGNQDSIGVLADHSDIQGLDVMRFAVGATRLKESSAGDGSRVNYETRYGLLAAHDHVKIDGGDTYNLPTLTATAEWLRRDVDSKYNPREGNLLVLGTGAGVTLNGGDPYTRLRLRGQQWWPVGQRDLVTVRGEVGKVWASRDTQVPDDFGFRTGGARSIRGYSYLSIGADRGNAVVGAPTLLVGSVEYDHYFDDRWGMAVFVDAGDAAQSFGDMNMAVGYGVGARVRTPAGPLFLDVAYGQRDHSLKLSFSLGIAF